MENLREQFLLSPEITFLNFGSFGATPKPIFEAYQKWQRVLEAEPVQFIAFDGINYLADARAKGDKRPDEIVLFEGRNDYLDKLQKAQMARAGVAAQPLSHRVFTFRR